MKKNNFLRRNVAFALLGSAMAAFVAMFFVVGVEIAAAQTIDEMVNTAGVAPKLALTAAQKSAIYQAVHKDKSKVAPSHFATNVGAEVPPMIELYALPDDVVADNPVAKLYKFTRMEDEVVLVDPTKMQVIDVIRPGRNE